MYKTGLVLISGVIITLLLSNCETKRKEIDLEIEGREILSLDNYSKDNKQGNAILLDPVITKKNLFANKIDVSIMHGANLSPLSNLIFGFSIDEESFYATSKNYRFDKKPILSQSDTLVQFKVDLNELEYYSLTHGQKISTKNFISQLKTSKKISFWATMQDMSLLENPLSSSNLRHSLGVEIVFK